MSAHISMAHHCWMDCAGHSLCHEEYYAAGYDNPGLNLYILTFSDFERGSSLFPQQDVRCSCNEHWNGHVLIATFTKYY